MSEKPEALRLADRLDLWGDQGDLLEAAAELRRLHAENERLRSDLATLRAENYNTQSLLKGAEAECDALRRHIKLLQSKVDAEKSCACAYDNPDEVCLPHSPLVEELRAECDALRSDAERWKFVLRHSWKDLQRVRVLAGIKTDSVLGPNWQDAVDDLLEAAGTAEQAIAARAALKEELK